jgi:hypothetical protein
MIIENVYLQAGVSTPPSSPPWLSGITTPVISRSLWKYTSIHCSHGLDAHKKDYGEAAQHLGMERHFGMEFLVEKTKNQNYLPIFCTVI